MTHATIEAELQSIHRELARTRPRRDQHGRELVSIDGRDYVVTDHVQHHPRQAPRAPTTPWRSPSASPAPIAPPSPKPAPATAGPTPPGVLESALALIGTPDTRPALSTVESMTRVDPPGPALGSVAGLFAEHAPSPALQTVTEAMEVGHGGPSPGVSTLSHV